MATSEILQKSRATITAQASGALAAGYDPNSGSYTGGAATVIDNTFDGGSENSKGSHFLNLELNVTTAPSTAATAEIWYRGSEDGTNYTKWKYSHTVGEPIVITTATRYSAGLFELTYQYTELKAVAVSYDFTSTLLATPKLYEGQ